MDQTHPEKPGSATPSGFGLHFSESHRSGLWRAIAGMAVALAIAAAIVAAEISHELVERVTHYRSRIATLNSKVTRLTSQAEADKKRLADVRAELRERKLMEMRDRVKAIVIAPDRRIIKLAAPDASTAVSATVTVSAKMGGAVLNARGLPSPPEGQVYDAWWMLKSAPPAKAAEFRSTSDGTANEYLDPPPQASAPLALAITLEPSQGGIAPSGPVKLSGRVPAGVGEERSGIARKH